MSRSRRRAPLQVWREWHHRPAAIRGATLQKQRLCSQCVYAWKHVPDNFNEEENAAAINWSDTLINLWETLTSHLWAISSPIISFSLLSCFCTITRSLGKISNLLLPDRRCTHAHVQHLATAGRRPFPFSNYTWRGLFRSSLLWLALNYTWGVLHADGAQ